MVSFLWMSLYMNRICIVLYVSVVLTTAAWQGIACDVPHWCSRVAVDILATQATVGGKSRDVGRYSVVSKKTKCFTERSNERDHSEEGFLQSARQRHTLGAYIEIPFFTTLLLSANGIA